MKYWWLKQYRDLKIEDIKLLINDVNYYLVMPKNYLTRYSLIKNIDIMKLDEDDLIIYLYCLLNHEKIKNNKVLIIIRRLLDYPDTSLPATNYSLEEELEEISKLSTNYPFQEKLSSNNIAACYHCGQIFYVDKIKYINKKGYCLCPYCKGHSIYFDNDFIPMDWNFLRLSKLYYEYTSLGCTFIHLKKLLKKCVKVSYSNILDNLNLNASYILSDDYDYKKDNYNYIERIDVKRGITSKEEMFVQHSFNEVFYRLENNMDHSVVIDLDIIEYDSGYHLLLSLVISIIEFLGRNPYIREIHLFSKNKKNYSVLKEFINTFCNYSK